MVGDACGSAFLHAGAVIGDGKTARAWAERFLALGGEPLLTKQRFFVLKAGGRTEMFMARGSCCLVYRIESHEYCATCPFTSNDERQRRLLDWMTSPS
jgi:FhuF 2Fe-2S C-terminal domain